MRDGSKALRRRRSSFGHERHGYRGAMENEEQDTTTDEATEGREFDPEEIENDPAYNPQDDEEAKDLKGG